MQDIQDLLNAANLTLDQRIKLSQLAAEIPNATRPQLENLLIETTATLLSEQNQKRHLIRQRLNG